MLRGARVRPIWGKDVGKAIFIAMNNLDSINAKRIVVSGDKERSFKELIVSLSRFMGKKVLFLYLPGWFGRAFFYALYYVSFHKIDFREKIDRLLEDKSFETSNDISRLGFCPTELAKSVSTYDVSK